jgi:hypothetical protein
MLAACNSSKTTEVVAEHPVVDQAETKAVNMKFIDISDSEYATMKAAGTVDAFIFEMENLQEHTQVAFWIEHYIDGKLQEKLMDFQSEVGDPSARHMLYFSSNGETTGEQLWTLAFREGNRVSSGKKKVQYDTTQSRVIQPLNEIKLLNDPRTIAYVMFGDGNYNQVVPEQEQQDEDNTIIFAHKEVYILKCKILRTS